MTEKEVNILITRYINGELNEKEEDQLWVEFLKNKHYFRQFETELNLHDLFQNKGYSFKNSDSEIEEPKSKYTSLLYAAAAIIFLVSGLYFFSKNNASTEMLAVSEIELSEMIGSEVYRDDNSEVSEYAYEINSALASALNGNLTEAYQILEKLDFQVLSEQNKQRAQFNMGVISYNSGDYELSVTHFSNLTDTENIPIYLRENALWYKANGYLKLQDELNAEAILQRVIVIEDQHAEKAKNILSQLKLHN